MAMFNSFLYVYQRVYPPNGHIREKDDDQIRGPRFSPGGALAIWPWPGRQRFRFMRRKTEDLKDASSQVFLWLGIGCFFWLKGTMVGNPEMFRKKRYVKTWLKKTTYGFL